MFTHVSLTLEFERMHGMKRTPLKLALLAIGPVRHAFRGLGGGYRPPNPGTALDWATGEILSREARLIHESKEVLRLRRNY